MKMILPLTVLVLTAAGCCCGLENLILPCTSALLNRPSPGSSIAQSEASPAEPVPNDAQAIRY